MVYKEDDDVILVLSKEEAQFIRDLLGMCVIGSPSASRRMISDSIWKALGEAGFIGRHSKDLRGSVECQDIK